MFDVDSQLWIHLSGLPMRLTEGDIVCILSQYGEILEISLSDLNENEDSTRSCFIKYESARYCDRAVHYLHEARLLGNKLDVIYADKLYLKKKIPPRDDVDEKTEDMSISEGGDTPDLDEDNLITTVEDERLIDSKCISEHLKVGPSQDRTSKQCGSSGKESIDRREKHHSSSTKYHHLEPSSTRSDSKLRDSNSPARSSKSRYLNSTSHKREPPLRYKDSYSPHGTHYSNSNTASRYREDSPAPRRRIPSPRSPDRRSRTRSSFSSNHERIPSPSSPNDRSRECRDSHSPRNRHYSSRSSPHREYDAYRRYHYVRVSPHRYSSRYVNNYTDRSQADRYRRSTSRCYSRSPQPERSRSRHRSSSQLRDCPRSSHRHQPSRSPSSSSKLDRVSSTSHTRSRSCQRDFGSREDSRSYYRKQVDDREKAGELPSSDEKKGGVGATGISLVLARRLSRHHETNGI